jgi:SpoVK/Ycf46/Vps4 family AAA+-type ATPase
MLTGNNGANDTMLSISAKARQLYRAFVEKGVAEGMHVDPVTAYGKSPQTVKALLQSHLEGDDQQFFADDEQDQSHSLIVAATNHPDILDYALFRCFDDGLHYQLPDEL